MAAIRNKCNHETGLCFMEKYHPKVEDFDGPHGTNPPRYNIQGTDIDYCTEVDGFVIFREFKPSRDMEWAQEKTLRTICDNAPDEHVAMQIVGDPARRLATEYRQYFNGRWTEWTACDWAGAVAKSQAFMLEAKERKRLRVISNRDPGVASRFAARVAA